MSAAEAPAPGAVEAAAPPAAEAPAQRTTEAAPVRMASAPVLNNSALPVPPVSSNPQPPAATTAPLAPATPETAAVPAAPAINALGLARTLDSDNAISRNDLWQRIRNGFALPDLDSPLIARHEQWYADRPEYVERMTERSRRYLYFIVEEVEKRGMPTEIALLPMIESAFNPKACSPANASGIWQFIPATGKKFGMQQNWWYDKRRDVISATKGALDYLQSLHDQFGDWELALAAYNWGENAVERAQERNRRRGLPTDYASLKLPDETRHYIPKLLAVKNIIGNPAKFGLTLEPIQNKPYFAAVATGRHIDVKLAAQLAGISMEEFTALNPAHNRPVILQEDNDVLLLPADKVETFRSNLKNYNDPLVSWQAYQTRKGERLDKLAPRFGLSVAKLKSINGLPMRTNISNGQALLVPLNGAEAEEEFEAFNTRLMPSTPAVTRALTHTVRKGETLASISRRYHVSVAKLKGWNDGVRQVKPGQSIVIAHTSATPRLAVKTARVKSATQHLAAKADKPRQLARSGKARIHTASAAKNHKHLARKTQHRVHVAYNR